LRQFRLQLGGKTYRLLRGEFHRHTELTAHRDQDGTLEDAWRYALDAAALDWMGLGDHDNGYHHEYLWWLSQKLTDIFHHPPHFVTVFTYDMSGACRIQVGTAMSCSPSGASDRFPVWADRNSPTCSWALRNKAHLMSRCFTDT